MAEPITTASGLTYEDIEPGTGTAAQSGQKAKVHYTGWLKNAEWIIEGCLTRSNSRSETGQYQRWDEGNGRRVGGKRSLRTAGAGIRAPGLAGHTANEDLICEVGCWRGRAVIGTCDQRAARPKIVRSQLSTAETRLEAAIAAE